MNMKHAEKLGICVICDAAGKTCFLFLCLVWRSVFHPSGRPPQS